MIRYLLRRIAHGVFVMFVVVVTVFFVTRVISNPARRALGVDASPERVAQLQVALGLDAPILTQFGRFLRDAVTLDFGQSLWQREPALGLVLERLPATLQLVLTSLTVAVFVFVPLGIVAALRPGSRLDRALVAVSLVGVSMPQFWFGAVLILVFAVNLGWLPTSGRGPWQALVLPAVTLAVVTGGRIAQLARSAFIDQLSAPYVLTARAKGFSTPYILRRHVLRNTLVPLIAFISFEFAAALAGYAVIVETLFAWPGVARVAVQAIREQDIVLVQAVVFVAALIVVVVNIVVDVVFKFVDPRIKLD